MRLKTGNYLPHVDTPPEYMALVCSRIHCPKSPVAPPKFYSCSLSIKFSSRVLSQKKFFACSLCQKKSKSPTSLLNHLIFNSLLITPIIFRFPYLDTTLIPIQMHVKLYPPKMCWKTFPSVVSSFQKKKGAYFYFLLRKNLTFL